jgi:hypothetical protein
LFYFPNFIIGEILEDAGNKKPNTDGPGIIKVGNTTTSTSSSAVFRPRRSDPAVRARRCD